mmetsp:Transcript_6723/g.27410  ORF Transcript_6723/g.27410 Transcript_6723/m.27410 type:complete len:338 (+) Transcript_6723:219-1232(+)
MRRAREHHARGARARRPPRSSNRRPRGPGRVTPPLGRRGRVGGAGTGRGRLRSPRVRRRGRGGRPERVRIRRRIRRVGRRGSSDEEPKKPKDQTLARRRSKGETSTNDRRRTRGPGRHAQGALTLPHREGGGVRPRGVQPVGAGDGDIRRAPRDRIRVRIRISRRRPGEGRRRARGQVVRGPRRPGKGRNEGIARSRVRTRVGAGGEGGGIEGREGDRSRRRHRPRRIVRRGRAGGRRWKPAAWRTKNAASSTATARRRRRRSRRETRAHPRRGDRSRARELENFADASTVLRARQPRRDAGGSRRALRRRVARFGLRGSNVRRAHAGAPASERGVP